MNGVGFAEVGRAGEECSMNGCGLAVVEVVSLARLPNDLRASDCGRGGELAMLEDGTPL